ncbi:hypothetical protein [Virgibacillus pantothenticus]|uniref:hypothetical protein n=1 Tax=Virgibacillus pantothenticus TaxID=1473 RepID=UPI003D17278D
MRQLQKTGESGYRQRDSVEHEGYVEAHSAFHGEQNNQNGVSNLFERILSRNNLNQAYLQVVRNKGAAGDRRYDVRPATSILEGTQGGTINPVTSRKV